jgi:hypothetical protein
VPDGPVDARHFVCDGENVNRSPGYWVLIGPRLFQTNPVLLPNKENCPPLVYVEQRENCGEFTCVGLLLQEGVSGQLLL